MTKTQYFVYAHVNKINRKVYVGITKDLEQRWGTNGCHYNYMRRGCFRHAIDKYGWNNFEHIILECGLTLKEARILERLYIKALDAKVPNGYNLTDGGEGTQGCSHSVSLESRRLMSQLKRGKSFTIEHRQKLSRARKNRIDEYGVCFVQPNNGKPVLQYDSEGNYIGRYESAVQASLVVGVHSSAITKASKGQLKTAGGYIWKREEKEHGTYQ